MKFYLPGTEESNDLWTHVDVTVIYLGGDTLSLCYHPVFFLISPTNFSIAQGSYLPCSNYYCGVLVFLGSLLYKECKFLFINSFEI